MARSLETIFGTSLRICIVESAVLGLNLLYS